jgi:hypothetical protein
MKKQYSILPVLAALLISFSASAGNDKYNLGSTEFKMPNLKPTKSIQTIQATAGNKGITEGGFYLHYNPYVPSKKYGYLKSGTITVNEGATDQYTLNQTDVNQYISDIREVGKFGAGHGLEIGNMFRLSDFEPMAIGLRVTWLDFGISTFKANSAYNDYNVKGLAIDIRLLKVGPYFTFALSDQMALDAFYQVSPTFVGGFFAGEYVNSADETEVVGYPILQYGLGHEIGLTYRFDILSVGLGYGMGSLNTNIPGIPVGNDTYSLSGKSYVGTFRMMLGMKF